MKTLSVPSTLTDSQMAEMRRLKAYFPYRIVWAEITPSGGFECFAHFDRRALNKSPRLGNQVAIL